MMWLCEMHWEEYAPSVTTESVCAHSFIFRGLICQHTCICEEEKDGILSPWRTSGLLGMVCVLATNLLFVGAEPEQNQPTLPWANF